MELLDFLPHFQASLNALSLVLITLGYMAIKSGNRDLHKKIMISALCVSAVFLVSYLYYHANIGHVPFASEDGTIRAIYFTILFIHIAAAAVTLGMIIITVWRALVKQDFVRHKAIARYTFPTWAFVCVSGIVVYVMAFHMYAAS
jgi:putative membrane protein